jgi:hypothetical protein
MMKFVYLRSSRLNVLHFGLIHALSTMGEVWAWNGLLDAFRKFFRWFRAFSGLWCAPVWPVEVTGLTSQRACFVHMLSTGLTGESWVVATALFQVVFCMHSSIGSCIGSGGACMCAGGALCGCSSFGLVVCALCLSLVLSRMCRVVALA